MRQCLRKFTVLPKLNTLLKLRLPAFLPFGSTFARLPPHQLPQFPLVLIPPQLP